MTHILPNVLRPHLALGTVAVLVAVTSMVPPASFGEPLLSGAATTVAMDRTSGRIAVLTGNQVVVFADGSMESPVASFGVAASDARLVQLCGDLVVISFAAEEHWAALDLDGQEWLIWPNAGIGEHFPTAGARLTADGRGLFELLSLDEEARLELGIPADVPVGAGVVASFRFADERVSARFSSAFAGALAVSPESFVVALSDGGALRYTGGDGVVWKNDSPGTGPWRLLDLSLRQAAVIAQDSRGDVIALGLEGGGERARRRLPGELGELKEARLLSDGRVLVRAGSSGGRLAVIDLGGARPDVADLLASPGVAEPDLVSFWGQGGASLDWALEIAPARLLLRGRQGWYRVSLE